MLNRAIIAALMFLAVIVGAPRHALAHQGHDHASQARVTVVSVAAADVAAAPVVISLQERAALQAVDGEARRISLLLAHTLPLTVTLGQGSTHQARSAISSGSSGTVCMGGCCCTGISHCNSGSCCSMSVAGQASLPLPLRVLPSAWTTNNALPLLVILGLERPPKA